jgi:hypothetical protein
MGISSESLVQTVQIVQALRSVQNVRKLDDVREIWEKTWKNVLSILIIPRP